jgi:hypothetical protein
VRAAIVLKSGSGAHHNEEVIDQQEFLRDAVPREGIHEREPVICMLATRLVLRGRLMLDEPDKTRRLGLEPPARFGTPRATAISVEHGWRGVLGRVCVEIPSLFGTMPTHKHSRRCLPGCSTPISHCEVYGTNATNRHSEPADRSITNGTPFAFREGAPRVDGANEIRTNENQGDL